VVRGIMFVNRDELTDLLEEMAEQVKEMAEIGTIVL